MQNSTLTRILYNNYVCSNKNGILSFSKKDTPYIHIVRHHTRFEWKKEINLCRHNDKCKWPHYMLFGDRSSAISI